MCCVVVKQLRNRLCLAGQTDNTAYINIAINTIDHDILSDTRKVSFNKVSNQPIDATECSVRNMLAARGEPCSKLTPLPSIRG